MSREAADKRLERLLVMVPWVVSHEGPTVEEVCARFAMTPSDLAADLQLLFVCGLHPFTPDALMEAEIVDGRVWIRYADAFERPPTFTPEEAVSLVAAGSAVLDLPGNDNAALASAIGKLTNALGISDEEAVDVELAPAAPELLDLVRQATERHSVLETDYYSFGRDAWSRRSVEPYRVFNSEGQWYVQGRDPAIDAVRHFRIDRMRNAVPTEQHFDPPQSPPETKVYVPRPDDPEVTLELDQEARWVASQYPIEHGQEVPEGKLQVTLKVSETAWLERLLLRTGHHATVVGGKVDVAGAARRLLRRYE